MSYFASQGPKREYAPARVCIYCGERGKPGETLGEEHIIPLSFGGNLFLPLASCRTCEKITSAIENHCVNGMLSTARPHLGIRGRQRSGFAKKGPVYFERGKHIGTKSVPIDLHPGALMVPMMPIPAAIVGLPCPIDDSRSIPLAVRIVLKPMTQDIAQRAWAIDRSGLSLTKGQSAVEFYRLIAKIAHSFTVAELGVGSFEPTLLNLICLRLPMFADHWVGSGALIDPPSDQMHEISFASSAYDALYEFIIVRIRLFANLEMPTHFAVSGFRQRK